MTTQTIIKFLADGTIVPILLIAGYALLFKVPREQRFQAYSRILMAGLTAYLFAKLLGSAYQPSGERPFEILGVDPGASYLDNPGFPSDHVLFATFLTLATWFETHRRGLTMALAALTLLMGTGRVLALVHTPLDVIGGLAIATLGAVWYLRVDRTQITSPTVKKAKKLVQ